NREMEWLRAVILYAFRRKWLHNNLFTEGEQTLILKSEEEPRARVPSPEEEERILSHCDGPREHLRAILVAARDTGLRKSALRPLEWSRVDFETGFLRIPGGNRYKKRPKAIGMTTRLRFELLALWEKSDKILQSKIFGGIKDVKRSYNTACRKAGVTDLHF